MPTQNVPLTLPKAASGSVAWPNLDSSYTRNVTIDCTAWVAFVFANSVASVSLVSATGVTIGSLANTASTVTFQQTGGSNGTNNAVSISVTTDTGHTETISLEIPIATTSGSGSLYARIAHSAVSSGSVVTEYEFDVTAHGAKGDGSTNDQPAFATALALAAARAVLIGSSVNVLVPAAVYAVASAVSIPAMVNLVGKGKPVLRATGSTGAILSSSAGQFSVENITLDGNSSAHSSDLSPTANFASLSKIVFRNVDLVNPTGGLHFTSCDTVLIERVTITGSKGHGVYFNGTHDSEVRGSNFQSLTYFGVILTNGCYRNLIHGNKTTSNGIELVGITQDSYENRIMHNHAEGTGDNGISCTGYKNIIIGNVCKGCQGNGIEVYGERNVVVGNHCLNNSQGYAGNSGWRAGIAVQGAFGGLGQFNTITGNTCDDDQTSKTQQYGIWLSGQTAYTAWATGQTISGASANSPVYRYNGANLYKATANGTTGSTAPTHTTGSASDGGITWTFVRTALAGSIGSFVNEVSSNNIARAAVSKYLDASGGSGSTANEISASFQSLVLPSSISVSSIGNAGGVATAAVSGSYTINNGSAVTLTVAAPNISGGAQATVAPNGYFMFGFGSIGSGGSGYAVNDILSFSGGTPSTGNLRIKVTSVDGSGAVTGFTNDSTNAAGNFVYTALPPAGAIPLTGGAGSGATLNATVWHLNGITVTSAGSGYNTPPAITSSGISGTPIFTTTTSASITVSAGAGNVLLDSTGTKLGVSGSTGSPVIALGASVDGSGVRTALTTAGYTVPANTSLVRFTQASTIASATVTLPTAVADGQVIQFVNYSGTVTAFTFSPAVTGWTNGNPFNAGAAMRIRWDATDSKWYREQ